ncbi:hypothetical protein WICPIJ_009898 [Wickerhamomyces pijperi]|uniref:Smr domain-containing protein n=1 Tax=Wickerhamomyces pijperi TaxID=599730 RepID=A0A9P8PKD9_WICPI|nr:hypothetical protein WICPIJ_009898 [Wickerhamomyces pijperi]
MFHKKPSYSAKAGTAALSFPVSTKEDKVTKGNNRKLELITQLFKIKPGTSDEDAIKDLLDKLNNNMFNAILIYVIMESDKQDEALKTSMAKFRQIKGYEPKYEPHCYHYSHKNKEILMLIDKLQCNPELQRVEGWFWIKLVKCFKGNTDASCKVAIFLLEGEKSAATARRTNSEPCFLHQVLCEGRKSYAQIVHEFMRDVLNLKPGITQQVPANQMYFAKAQSSVPSNSLTQNSHNDENEDQLNPTVLKHSEPHHHLLPKSHLPHHKSTLLHAHSSVDHSEKIPHSTKHRKIDLHGETTQTARHRVSTTLREWWSLEQAYRIEHGQVDVKGSNAVHVEFLDLITGRGLHSDSPLGFSKLKVCIRKVLKEGKWVHKEYEGGFLVTGCRK